MKHLILGGARSGKSRFAEETAALSGKSLFYVATAQALDDEMQLRIAHHRSRRDRHWTTVEEPLALAGTLRQFSAAGHCIVVDCLTLWLTNCLLAEPGVLERQRNALLSTLPQLPGDIILVSNEVGMGIVPADALSRLFVDEAGRLHQALASLCDRVTLMAAGLPLGLK